MGGIDSDPALAGGSGGSATGSNIAPGQDGADTRGNHGFYDKGGAGEVNSYLLAEPGRNGQPGSPATAYGLSDRNIWSSGTEVQGGSGSNGTPGNPGGGGGSADHFSVRAVNCSGGGGGAGGLGGGPGQGGARGGASLAVVLVQSQGGVLLNNALETSAGGQGGNGGQGGRNMPTGICIKAPGPWISTKCGDGGKGSDGTAGGGGSGGPSYGIYRVNSTVAQVGNQFTVGSGGLGGSSPTPSADAQGFAGLTGNSN